GSRDRLLPVAHLGLAGAVVGVILQYNTNSTLSTEMEAAVHTTDTSPARGSCRFRIAAAAACVALLAVAWSSPGLAAARTSVGCDRVAHNLESLDVDTLAIEVVDLSDVEQAEPSDALADSVAPFLFLTPRV